jgi:hypothetical protein
VLPAADQAVARRGDALLLSALHPRGASQYVTGPRSEAARTPADLYRPGQGPLRQLQHITGILGQAMTPGFAEGRMPYYRLPGGFGCSRAG